MIFFLGLFLTAFLAIGCNDSAKEKKMQLREEQLSRREAVFAQKEAEYEQLLKMRDSIHAKQDSLQVKKWPDSLAGNWNAKTICTESNCSSYVIGDQRTDSWQFVNNTNGLGVKVFNNNDLIRMYNGIYSTNQIKLSFITDSTAQKEVEMKVILNDFLNNKIKGLQTITIDGSCRAIFSVELVKSKN